MFAYNVVGSSSSIVGWEPSPSFNSNVFCGWSKKSMCLIRDRYPDRRRRSTNAYLTRGLMDLDYFFAQQSYIRKTIICDINC